eukprot:PhM_4_TR4242/c0_g1_i1/m.74916
MLRLAATQRLSLAQRDGDTPRMAKRTLCNDDDDGKRRDIYETSDAVCIEESVAERRIARSGGTYGALPSLILLEECTNIRFSGLVLLGREEAVVGVSAFDCTDVIFEDCVLQVPIACAADGGQDPVSTATNQHYGSSLSIVDKLRTARMPTWCVLLGYVYVLVVLALFTLGSLFVTSAMTQAEADDWIARSIVSILIKVLLVTPVICVVKTVLYVGTLALNAVNGLDSGASALDFDFGGAIGGGGGGEDAAAGGGFDFDV